MRPLSPALGPQVVGWQGAGLSQQALKRIRFQTFIYFFLEKAIKQNRGAVNQQFKFLESLMMRKVAQSHVLD